MTNSISVIMIGATGAVGTEVVNALVSMPQVSKITLLGRRKWEGPNHPKIKQYIIDIFDASTFFQYLKGHDIAICTVGVGQPSMVSNEEFIKVDKIGPLEFAKSCKQAGVKHFELLSSVGISANSSSLYLRTKGELVEELKALKFEKLSIFKPSMILTPTNRYGAAQAITLAIWPLFHFLFFGKMKKYRGIKVSTLGTAIAKNVLSSGHGVEMLEYSDFTKLTNG